MKLLADTKSHFSIGESLLTPDEIASYAASAGYDAAALCDTMSISAMPDFTKACDKAGIKPIVGVRLRIVPSLDKVDKQHSVFPKLYILTSEGFEIVTRLLSIANDADHFHRVARLSWSDVLDALQHAKGHIAYSTGSLYSASRDEDAVRQLKDISALLTRDLTFSEICPGDSAVWDRQAQVAYAAADDYDVPGLLSRPCLYHKTDGQSTLGLMTSVVNNHKRNYNYTFESYLKDYRILQPGVLVQEATKQVFRLKSYSVVNYEPLRDYEKSWTTLCDAVVFKWHKLDVSLPKMADDENAALWELAKKGLRNRLNSEMFGHRPVDHKTYVNRLKYEMGVLTDMGFAGYFLLTHEIVKWSKDNGVLVGPGRGSVGGSLVAYALNITDVDPIRFGLIFERFINPERLDLPDADLDFMSTRRHEVIDYIKDRFGREYVAGISNYSMLGSKAALGDLSRIVGDTEGQGIGKFIPSETGAAIPLARAYDEVAEVKAFADRKQDLWNTACDIEGKMRTLSVHAAGIVVAGEPLVKRAVVEMRKGDAVVNWDKRVVEDMGLVKMDILGLSTLDLIAIALKKIKKRTGATVDLNAIPLDEETVLKAFGDGKTIGIFQFESGGMRRLLKDIYKGGHKIAFDDISAATALYRPGPMESGLMDAYVEIKQGFSSETYAHPSMQAALEETYSVIVYQEQVMKIAQDLCGFTMAEADILRKAIGKKDKDLMDKQGAAFIDGAEKAGMQRVVAESLWDQIVKFAGYAFNKSHSTAYTLISYQAMWLKVHHPVEFYAAALTVLSDDKRPGLIKDAQRSRITVVPPDVNYSTDEFEILTDNVLAAPFSIMQGLSTRGAVEILLARKSGPFKDAADFEARVERRVVNKSVRDKLNRVGAFARIEAQPPANDESRRIDQLELVPSIMVGGATVNREVQRDKETKIQLLKDLEEFAANQEVCKDAVFVTPKMGRNARFMAIFDGPGYHDERAGKFAMQGIDAVEEALDECGLEISDGYWTGLCKTPKKKGEQLYSPDVLHAYKPLLEDEIALLNPQVIICLGTNAARFFDPGMRGGIADHTGKIIYRKATDDLKNDRNIIIGITPGMIYFDPTKQVLLNEAFQALAEMIQ